MSEEILWALSDISKALSIFRQPSSNWESLTALNGEYSPWRTRWDCETKLLIEEVDDPQTNWGDWKVVKIHQNVEDRTEAVLLAAQLTQVRLDEISRDNLESKIDDDLDAYDAYVDPISAGVL